MTEADSKRWALMMGQFQFLKTRQEAFERLLRKSTLIDRIRWALNPLAFIVLADAVQQSLLEQARKAFKEAAARPHIEVVRRG